MEAFHCFSVHDKHFLSDRLSCPAFAMNPFRQLRGFSVSRTSLFSFGLSAHYPCMPAPVRTLNVRECIERIEER